MAAQSNVVGNGVGRTSGRRTAQRVLLATVALATLGPIWARAADVNIVGAQAAAIELPSIYGMIGLNNDSDEAFQAYLDTGTSGIILSQEDAEARNIQPQLGSNGQPVVFSDIAVNGSVEYHVSGPQTLRLGRYTGEVFDDTLTVSQTDAYFSQLNTGVRLQLSTTPADPFLGTPLNLIGMPALKNKVMVVDARLYNHLDGIDFQNLTVRYNGGIEQLADFPTDPARVPLPLVQTWVYDKGTTSHAATPLLDPGVPVGQHVVRMSYADFSGFTQLTPGNAIAPTLDHNPFVGPAPFTAATADSPPGITIHRGDGVGTQKTSGGSWLFDTGAQISFMSSAMARALGVQLSFDATTGDPILTDIATGAEPDGLFSVALGGAGGEAGTLLGFSVDELMIPTTDGFIRLHDIQIGVLDVTVTDAQGRSYTLDGDLGMNLLLPSMSTTGDLSSGGAFDFMAFDESSGLLTLTDTTAVPEPAALTALVCLGGAVLRRRRVQ